jgi:anti-anti-sigma regulatory factor
VNLSSNPVGGKADVVPLINLNGVLSAQAEAQFNQMLVIGQKSGAIKIDLKRLRSIDDTGCKLLMDMVAQFSRDRVKLFLINGSALISMLEGQLHPGQAEGRDTWLLVLELLQYTDEIERFEELALEYAITFEESPPSWEPRPQPPAAVAASREQEPARREGEVCLEGELTGANNDSIRRLASLASSCQKIEVDCSQLRRMDFVSAGNLFNILSSLQTQGRIVSLLNVNAMVGALLRVMGVDKVARVTMRH